MQSTSAKSLALIVFGMAALAEAHLLPIKTPKAEDSYTPGDTVLISWGVYMEHQTQDIAFSTDDKTWTPIATGLDSSVVTFNWVVPSTPSTKVRIRICQHDNYKGTVAGCTDTHNYHNPTVGFEVAGGKLRTAISDNFTIATATAVVASSLGTSGPRIRVNSDLRSVEADFTLVKAERVSIQAYDMQGKLLAVLLDEHRAAGSQRVSVFATGLDVGRAVVFKVGIGDRAYQISGDLSR